MDKSQLIDALAATTQQSKKDVRAVIDALGNTIAHELRKGESVDVFGLGKFKVAERAARQGRNPQTGETITIAARRAPTFTAAKALKDAVA